ncbi:MAG TPA: hypothetical protein VHU13_05420 [Solirubrobacteraceae bacterium]|nr:hypothetical protein [Solirubrobacteraceae bacterium]
MLCTFALPEVGDASAAPIVVNLRVEGSNATMFEGPVTTDAESITTTSSGGAHECDVKDNGSNGGFGVSSGTPTTALRDAAAAAGLSFDATWSSTLTDFLVTQVGSDVNGGAPEYPSWGYAVNYTTAGVGGCQFQLAPGSEVLWAYNYFNLSHLLSLSAPANVSAGTPFVAHVTDGQTGEPIEGASIGEDVEGLTRTIPGSTATDAKGNATIVLSHVGSMRLKATQAQSVRSNGALVCVHEGNDGTCGTSKISPGNTPIPKGAPTPIANQPIETVTVGGAGNGHHYRRHAGPRILTGAVTVPVGATLRQVRISLLRRHAEHCQVFSNVRGRFVRARCGSASFFSVGATESFSYLLPGALPSGRYVYEVEAVDAAGHVTKPVLGTSKVVFYVR